MDTNPNNTEYKRFDEAMGKLLKVPPQIVKDAMEAEKQERAEQRKLGRKTKPKKAPAE